MKRGGRNNRDRAGVVLLAEKCSLRLRGGGFGGVVVAGDGPQGNRQAIPQIDSPDHEGQVHDLLFTEMRLQGFVDVVGGVRLRNERESFGPVESGAFAVCEKGSLAPSLQRVEALLAFSRRTRIERLHIRAVRTAVDL